MANEDIEALYDKHGEATVRKAFWLQDHIYKHGLDGVHFTKAAEEYIEQQGPMLVKKSIEDEFTRDI